MENKKRKVHILQLLAGVLIGTASALAGFFLVTFILHGSNAGASPIKPNDPMEGFLYVVVALISIWIGIAVHELGHLLAGLLQGFHFALFTAGFLGIRAGKDRVEVFFNRDINSFGGLAATFPTSWHGEDLRKKMAIIVAAGPLSSLLLGIGSLVLAWSLMPHGAHKVIIFGLFCLGGLSLLLFVSTSIPSRAGGFTSDGGRFLALLRGGKTSAREQANLALVALLCAGKTPGELPADLVATISEQEEEAINLTVINSRYLAFSYHLDRGEIEAARSQAQFLIDHQNEMPQGYFQRYFMKEVVFFYAFVLKDIQDVQVIWENIKKGADRDADGATFRVKAALELLEGARDQAIIFARIGLQKSGKIPFAGLRNFETKWFGKILKEAQF
jgi:hypothetical protein